MNTINNPLILTFHIGRSQYVVNKPNDQSGEYIDKALAEEMLQMLESLVDKMEGHEEWWMSSPNKGGFDLDKINELILKAKG